MQIIRLIVKEILHRKVHFVLGLVAVVTAVGLFVAFMTTARASNRETAKLMLKVGFNLRIIPKETDMNAFLINGFSDRTMPADHVDKIAKQKGFSYNHLLATLQQKISWRDMDVILTGLAPEKRPPDKKTPPMVFAIKPGTAYVGFVIAEKLGLKEGQIIEINGTPLSIVDCLDESGTVDDIRIQCDVGDAQAILNLPGRINEIQAVDCLCFAETDDPLAILRGQMAKLLPDAKVVQMSKLAAVRKEQRLLVKNHLSFIMTVVVVVCGVWIGVLATLNVRQRESEIGIMRAIGYGSGKVVALLLGKAVVMGVCGAVLGFAVGVALAVYFGPGIFEITAKAIKADYTLLYWSIAAAPVFAAIASFIPVMIAIAQDPADTLRKE